MNIYVVQENDTVDSIAALYGAPVEDIIFTNQLAYPYPLAVGQALAIPVGQPAQQFRRQILSTGYAYPFIQENILQETLPYLTQLYVFSYGFDTEGELIPPSRDDGWMIEQASWFGSGAVLVLTPLDSAGRFNNELISAIVNDQAAKERLFQNLLETMEQKGFQGVDIDFEYIKAEDRDAFTAFVAELTGQMNVYGYQVTVALAPKTSSDQPGLLYQGKDYAGLGAAANRVLLMTYEWGYTYGHGCHRYYSNIGALGYTVNWKLSLSRFPLVFGFSFK